MGLDEVLVGVVLATVDPTRSEAGHSNCQNITGRGARWLGI